MFRREGLVFREVEREDLELLRRNRNDESTWTTLGSPLPVTPSGSDEWLESLGKSRFAFVVEDEAVAVGFVRLDEIDFVNRSIRTGCDVFPEFRGRGYGKRIMRGVTDWAFNELGLHRCWLLVMNTNPVAIKVYVEVGYKHEGEQREAVFRGGKWRDYLMMGILEDEWR